MPRFHPLSESNIFPFTPHDYQYFILRTGGNVLSTLVETSQIAADHTLEFEMGYTNLWIMRRVGLYLDSQKAIHYADPEESYRGDREGRYYILGDQGTSTSWRKEGEKMVLGFQDRLEAERCMAEVIKPGENCLIARLLRDIYWH